MDVPTGTEIGGAVGGSGLFATLIGFFFKNSMSFRHDAMRHIENLYNLCNKTKEELSEEMATHALRDAETFVTKFDYERDLSTANALHDRHMDNMRSELRDLRLEFSSSQKGIESKIDNLTNLMLKNGGSNGR